MATPFTPQQETRIREIMNEVFAAPAITISEDAALIGPEQLEVLRNELGRRSSADGIMYAEDGTILPSVFLPLGPARERRTLRALLRRAREILGAFPGFRGAPISKKPALQLRKLPQEDFRG